MRHIQGNPAWEMIIKAKQLRRKQLEMQRDFDPVPKELYTAIGKTGPTEEQEDVTDVRLQPVVEDPYNILGGQIDPEDMPTAPTMLT